MANFDSEFVQTMRNALEDVMTKVPPGYATLPIKIYLAECILKAAAQGTYNYQELVAAAVAQIQMAISLFN